MSIGLPHGVRRFEFMIFDHETDEQVADPLFVHQLLARHVPDPAGVDFIRQRVYTLHARIAGAFRKGHVLIAGDAAHLMPVWQGQGFNSGVRDSTNLAWKLTAVLRGLADDALLDTYDTERRDHAKAMIDVSVAMGRILSPTNKAVAGDPGSNRGGPEPGARREEVDRGGPVQAQAALPRRRAGPGDRSGGRGRSGRFDVPAATGGHPHRAGASCWMTFSGRGSRSWSGATIPAEVFDAQSLATLRPARGEAGQRPPVHPAALGRGTDR